MKQPFDQPDDTADIREQIIGLGEKSIRKSYYPELQERLADLERFKTLLDQSSDAIFLTDIPSGRLIYGSRSACAQIGVSEEQCYRMTLYDIVPESAERLEEVFSGKASSIIFDAMLRKSNGEKVPYELNMRVVAFKNRKYVVAIARDVTERKRAQEDLRESEEKFRALAESSAAGIVVYQGEWLVSANPAAGQITGYPPDELMKMQMIDLIHPDFKEAVRRRALARQRGEPEPSQYETMIVTGRGEKRWVLLSVGLMMYQGRPAGVVTLLDITERKQTEDALRKSEMLLTRSQDIAHLGSFEWDILHDEDKWSDELYHIFGLKPGGVKPSVKAYLDLVHPDDRAMIEQHVENVRRCRKNVVGYDARIIRPDGTIRWIRFDGGLVPDARGRLDRMIGTIMDITDRKQAEETLQASETKYRIVADNTHDWEFWISPEDLFVYTSPSCERISGYTAYEFTADPALFMNIVHPDDAQQFCQHSNKVKEYRKAGELEFRIVRKDGTIRWIQHVCQPVFDGRGGYIGVRGSNRDTTDRKLAEIDRERLLREIEGEQLRLRTILESLPVAVLIFDKEGRIVTTNPYARNYWGGTVPPTIGALAKSGALWSEDGGPFVAGRSGPARALRDGETTVNEVIEFERVKGSRFTLICSTAPTRDSGGAVNGAVMIFADITEMRKLEKELGELKRQAELYLDLMGHDIINMNQALMGYLELMDVMQESGKIDKALIEHSIDVISRSSRMIGDVKKLTQLQAGKVSQKEVDLCQILSRVKARYSNVPRRQVTINYTPCKGYVIRACDLIEDVFDNLMDNAIRHSTGSVTIDISVDTAARDGRPYYRVAIADNGPGIPDDLKHRVFMTVKETPVGEKKERRGIGLYLVRMLIDYNRGHVWVEDRVPGDHTKGARFEVMLPAADT